MTGFQLTVKNYRCFADDEPLRLDVRDGFTALVGPNNAGKSTCLRLFYELRQVLGACAQISQLQSLTVGNQLGVGYLGTEDPVEIFHAYNPRPLVLQFDLPAPASGDISRIILTANRDQPTNWSGNVYAGLTHIKVVGGLRVGDVDGFKLPGGAGALLSKQFIGQIFDLANHSMYIGAFRNAISEGSGSYFDLARHLLHLTMGPMEDRSQPRSH